MRDVERLKSAIGTPSAVFGGEYLHPSIIEMAATYLYHLVENHPFMDGNKRGGAMALLIFLDMNGYEFEVADADLTAMVLKVAGGKMMKSEISVLFRQHAHSR